jgi:integrase
MTVKIRQYRETNMYEVDISFRWPDDAPFRERRRSPVSGKTASMRWGQAREAELLRQGKAALEPAKEKEVPTVAEFEERFIDGYAKANRQKASTISAKQRILRLHLVPALGHKRLDEIENEDIQKLKVSLAVHKPKTVNNVINVLSKLLHVAIEWGVIDRMPCTIKLLRSSTPEMKFYELDQKGRLVDAAGRIDHRILVMVLLGCDAGLRRGEIISLRQSDVDLRRNQIHVRLSSWQGVEDLPKSGRGRIIPLSAALAKALEKNRHLRGDRVLHQDDGKPTDENVLQDWMEQATRRAGLEPTRSLHILRHTFCSELAIKGAPAKAIQELAGHQSLAMTMRYMHLSPSARENAIRLLDSGEMLEKRSTKIGSA